MAGPFDRVLVMLSSWCFFPWPFDSTSPILTRGQKGFRIAFNTVETGNTRSPSQKEKRVLVQICLKPIH
jgi:hypothetical protein